MLRTACLALAACTACAFVAVAPPRPRSQLAAAARSTRAPTYWKWRGKHDIHFEQRGSSGPAVLLVPGFGVGTFHFSRNVDALAQCHRVWTVDLLGQGKSWPSGSQADGGASAAERGHVYGVESWSAMLRDFVAANIDGPVYVCGNSLGGLLCLMLAKALPAQVAGAVLLNPTPFWAFLPDVDERPAWLWNGALPAPQPYRGIGATWFNALRFPTTVTTMLGGVYADPAALDEQLVDDIVEAAAHPGGPAAFASILFAPKAPSLQALADGAECPVALVMGKEDPWITPAWGQRTHKALTAGGRDVPYVELSPSGHCPHHESPAMVNELVAAFIASVEGDAAAAWPEPLRTLDGGAYTAGATTARRVDGRPRGFGEFVLGRLLE